MISKRPTLAELQEMCRDLGYSPDEVASITFTPFNVTVVRYLRDKQLEAQADSLNGTTERTTLEEHTITKINRSVR